VEDFPKSLIEFEKRFATEEACREYLIKLRWPNGFRCPKCQHEKAWLTKRKPFHCTYCKHETSITAGTIFQDTRKPIQVWFRAMWYVVNQKNGVSALGLQRVLGFSRYETTWLLLHKLRRAMVRPNRDLLSGLVEVDETYIGGKKAGKRGRGAAGKALVLIAVEDKGNHFGRIRLKHISNASGESLFPVIKDNIESGSDIRTDGWNGYENLDKKGYQHIVARKSTDVGDNLLPLANRIASLLKRWIIGTHQGGIRFSHLDYYLDEFTFRFNRRTSSSRGKLFYRLIQQAVSVSPVKNQDIRGN